MRPTPHRRHATPQRGFTLIGVLLFAAVFAVAAAAAVTAGATLQRHAAEEDLLAAGLEFRNAFKSYYESALSTPRYPIKLEDLLRDPRFPGVRRHLRKLYADPLTGKAEWGTIPAPGGGIMGVYSLATDTPIKTALFPAEFAAFEGKATYAEWQFAYVAPDLLGNTGQATAAGTTQAGSSTSNPGGTSNTGTGSTNAAGGAPNSMGIPSSPSK